MRRIGPAIRKLVLTALAALGFSATAHDQSNPILFVTQTPNGTTSRT